MYNNNYHPHQDTEHEIVAHMTPAEVRELAQLQGGMEHDERNQLPSFRKLAHLMGQPNVQSKMIEWEGNRFAGGGEVDGMNEMLRKSGRYGDTEAVMLPRVVANLFDRALTGGHPSINPRTGKREYFLGGLLGGLSNIFNKVASPLSSFISPIAKTLAPVAGGVLSQFAPQIGQFAGNALGGVASSLGAGPLGMKLGNMAGNTLGGLASSLGQGLTNYGQGGPSVNPADLARQTASHFGQQAAPALGQHFGQSVSNYGQSMQNPYLSAGMQHLGNFGGQMMGNMGYEGANALGGNRMPQFGNTAQATAQNYLGGIDHPLAQGASQMLGGPGSLPPQQYAA